MSSVAGAQRTAARVHGTLRNLLARRPQSDHRGRLRFWQTCALSGGGWWQKQAPGQRCLSLRNTSSKMRTEWSSLVSSCSFESHERRRRAKHGRFWVFGVTFDATPMPGEAWATTFLCPKSRRSPLLMRCVLASSLLPTGLAVTLGGAACKLVVLEHRALPLIRAARHSANLAVTCMAHWIAGVGFARQRLDIDAVWLPGRWPANARNPGLLRCLCSQPSSVTPPS